MPTLNTLAGAMLAVGLLASAHAADKIAADLVHPQAAGTDGNRFTRDRHDGDPVL